MFLKKSWIVLLVLFISQATNNLSAQSCYELIWNDEFNYNGLPDSSLWYFEEGGTGWGNNELQYYTSKRIENAHVEDGYLTIEARKENFGGREYTSARLITYQNNHSWKYGKIEARVKLPYGQGIWSAFWALGDGIFEGNSWPGCGEIDILELIGGGEGKDDMSHGTIHYSDANNNHASSGNHYQLSQGIFADDFHVFSIEWTGTQIKWFVDDVQFHSASITNNELSEFHKEFFLLLNLAVGGNWPGNPNSSTVFPQKMLIDYVRVYQLNIEPEITGNTLINKAKKNLNFKTVESEDFTYNWSVPNGAIITDGQSTNSIEVTWGCDTGSVACELTTLCNTYNLSLSVKTKSIEISGNEILEAYSESNEYTIPELYETSFNWEVPTNVSFVGETDTNAIFLNWGNSDGEIIVSINNICGIEIDTFNVEIVSQAPFPDPNVSHKIPGTVKAINYDSGGEGFAYHDMDPENQGPGARQNEGVDTETKDGSGNIGWIKSGEWLEYSVNVESTEMYDIELRVASLNGSGHMEIQFNDENRTGAIPIPSTGSWSSFTSININDIQLYDTDNLMRLQFNVGDFNISRLIFSKKTTSVRDIASNLSGLRIYPIPASSILHVANQKEQFNFNIINTLGSIKQYGILNPGDDIEISLLKNGIYFLNLYNNSRALTLRFIKL